MESNINIMYLDFTRKLSLWFRHINNCIQRIDDSKIDIFGIIIAFFLMEDKNRRS